MGHPSRRGPNLRSPFATGFIVLSRYSNESYACASPSQPMLCDGAIVMRLWRNGMWATVAAWRLSRGFVQNLPDRVGETLQIAFKYSVSIHKKKNNIRNGH
jgi:hypothetical protein